MVDLAFVHEAADDADEAAAAYDRAVEIYEAKGNMVRAQEVRDRLASPVSV